MEKIFEECLDNGVQVEAVDRSKQYYGDFHQVVVEVVCTVPVVSALFATEAEYHDVLAILGPAAEYRKTIGRMGVPTAQVEAVRSDLLRSFLANAGAYLHAPDFPKKLISTNLMQSKGRKRGSRGTGTY